jgi:outer membrane lipoprotein-sorting protein
MKLLAALLFAIGSLLASTPALAQQIRSGEELLGTMRARYKESWYDTVTFTQKSTTYNPDGTTKVETWYEAAKLPGKLRINFGPPENRNGALLVDGTLTSFQNGKVAGTRPLINLLLVLGFDVYRQEPETTINELKQQGFDLTKLHEESWEGQPVYAVGADKGDLKSKQFWVEKNRSLFVRLIELAAGDPKKIQDIRFADYRQLTTGWIAARVEVNVDGRMVFTEEYSDIKTNVKLDPALFDLKQLTPQDQEK